MFVKVGDYLIKRDDIDCVYINKVSQWTHFHGFPKSEPIPADPEYAVYVVRISQEAVIPVFTTPDPIAALRVLQEIKNELNNATDS